MYKWLTPDNHLLQYEYVYQIVFGCMYVYIRDIYKNLSSLLWDCRSIDRILVRSSVILVLAFSFLSLSLSLFFSLCWLAYWYRTEPPFSFSLSLPSSLFLFLEVDLVKLQFRVSLSHLRCRFRKLFSKIQPKACRSRFPSLSGKIPTSFGFKLWFCDWSTSLVTEI